ncbi:ABC transporter permease [Neolewinella lacunae]|uniref:ABC transporter permease n=1 Tax=Neolewinella lacunae TaxID=1517758 RepID=A0A923T861_9BACT|nr:ABC transporter permease [Neolewinella lacunae]MBC6995260.1 ABC transporter permease [Neolewinella lacunae]MDN3635571.1 ABC transporter permease [Neolewinella lacunae]
MYAFRRLLYLPLSLLLLSLVCFGLQLITPGDPVLQLLPPAESRLGTEDPAAYDVVYRRAAASLDYDLPLFYFSLTNAALPDTLHRILRPEERTMLRALTLNCGDWPAVARYYRELRYLAYPRQPDSLLVGQAEASPLARRLLLQDDPQDIANIVGQLAGNPRATALVEAHAGLEMGQRRGRLLLPAFRWWGLDNRYHRWLGRVLRGDFGHSYLDRRPVGHKIWAAAKWTALLNGLALLVVYLVAIPLGLLTAARAGSRFDRVMTFLLFLLFGIPSFWIATLVTNFFTTPAYGMDFFPSMGFGEIPSGADWWTVLRIRTSHLFLPVLCLAYPSWAYVSRHLRRSALHELGQAYIKTAKLKGLTGRQILWGHVLRNASFPILTLLGAMLPALLAGSVLIERIFNLPGMGQLLYNSAVGRDWPVVIALVLLNGLLTAAGLLLADLSYSLADPRVRLGSERPNPSTAG